MRSLGPDEGEAGMAIISPRWRADRDEYRVGLTAGVFNSVKYDSRPCHIADHEVGLAGLVRLRRMLANKDRCACLSAYCYDQSIRRFGRQMFRDSTRYLSSIKMSGDENAAAPLRRLERS
jgi:hypothetical protein